MARNSTVIKLDTSVLDRMIKHTGGNVAEAVAKTAFAVEARGKIQIQQMDAIDTGALLNGMSTSLKSGGDMTQNVAKARALNPDAKITPLPIPKDDHTAYVGPTVEYAADVHFGNTRMAGRPFMLQAVRDTERDFRENLSKAVKPK